MKITVKNQLISKDIVEQNKVRLNLHFRKSNKALIMFGVLSLVFLIFGISAGDKYSMINTGEKKIFFNLNLFTSLGISCILVLFYVVRQMKLSKKNFLNAGYEIARKFDAINEMSYEFNQQEIIIDQELLYQKINWDLFVKKVYHDKYIFLNFSDKIMDGIVINGKQLSESDFLLIKEFIDKKVV